ncbi:MAG: aldo/keto reductase, partial [Candidatus Omnitrophica bacterium]|nr:aldo/keto reductase [Candidatus Omnitrophota bacterium]
KNVVRQSIETSLQCLQKASIELLSLHQTDEYIIHNSDFWEVINEFKERNIIHLFGVSVYEVENARELINEYGDFIDFIQIPYNIFDRRFDQIASLLTEKNIDVVSRSAYLKGIITIVEQEIPKELSNIKKFKRKLADLAESLNFNVQMLALLFVLNKEYISTTILGVNNTKEIEENVQALSKRGQLLDYEELLRELSIKDEFLIDPRRWKSI